MSCFNDDVMKSLTTITNVNGSITIPNSIGYKSNDITNFVMAIPCSTDGTYQQGQTSATPITYQFKAELSSESPYKNSEVKCELCFLMDSMFAIQCRGGQIPIVIIDEADITTPSSFNDPQ